MDTTVRFGTDVSWNIPAVKAGAYVGTGSGGLLATNLKLLGLNVPNLVASSPLGTSNATVLQMTDAYQTFANAGTRIHPNRSWISGMTMDAVSIITIRANLQRFRSFLRKLLTWKLRFSLMSQRVAESFSMIPTCPLCKSFRIVTQIQNVTIRLR